MQTTSFTTIVIKPEEGHYLTQAADVDIKDRVFASSIALGKNDSADNYIEITAEQKDLYKAEQEKAFEAERKANAPE